METGRDARTSGRELKLLGVIMSDRLNTSSIGQVPTLLKGLQLMEAHSLAVKVR